MFCVLESNGFALFAAVLTSIEARMFGVFPTAMKGFAPRKQCNRSQKPDTAL